jgi:hypothetical protein
MMMMKPGLTSTIKAINTITTMLPKSGIYNVHIRDGQTKTVLVCVYIDGDWQFVERLSVSDADKEHCDFVVMKKDNLRMFKRN